MRQEYPGPKVQTIQTMMILQAAVFALAALIHSGVILTGYEHPQARIAEAVIAIVLVLGLILTTFRNEWVRVAGLAAQGFALAGTLVGLFTIAIGIGPDTVLDLLLHGLMIVLLIWGLVITARAQIPTSS